MSWKRNVFSCVAWLAYLLLVVYGVYATAQLWMAGFDRYQQTVVYGIVGGVLLLAGLLNVFVWLIGKKYHPSVTFERIGWKILEGMILAGVLAAGVFFRLNQLPLLSGGEYFELAKVRLGQGVPLIDHGAGYLYVCCLHAVCFVLGNNLTFCICLQIALEVIAGLVCMLGIRRLTGRLSALLFWCVYFLGPQLNAHSAALGPQPMFLLFFGIGLLVVQRFLEKNEGLPIRYFLTGMVIAAVTYLDVSGLALWGIAFTVLYVKRKRAKKLVNRPLISLLIALLGFAVCMLGIFVADALLSRAAFERVIFSWTDLYFSAGNPSRDFMDLVTGAYGRISITVLVVLMASSVFHFFVARDRERVSAWTIAGVMLWLFGYFGIAAPAALGADVFLIALCALAGTAFKSPPEGPEEEEERIPMREWDPSLYGIVVEEEAAESDAETVSEAEPQREAASQDAEPVPAPVAEQMPAPVYEAVSELETSSVPAAVMETMPAPAPVMEPAAYSQAATVSTGAEQTPAPVYEAVSELETSSVPAAVMETAPAPVMEPAPEPVPAPITEQTPAESAEESAPAIVTHPLEEREPDREEAESGEENEKPAEDGSQRKQRKNGNPITSYLEKRRQKKEQQRQDIEKVLNALSSISSDPVIATGPESKLESLPPEKPIKETKKAKPAEEDGTQPLHNPLPVPKKRELNPLDYDYEVADDDDYDYD